MDVFRPESPGTKASHQALGPKPSDNPASAFSSFHQEDGNSMRATEPVRFQCLEQQISCSFLRNPTIVTFGLCLIGINFLTWALVLVLHYLLCPEEAAIASLHLGPSQSPGPRRDGGARPAAAKRGCPCPHWDGLGDRGTGGFQGEQGGLWSDAGGKLQVNSKNIHLGDPGGGRSKRERIWVHPQHCSWLQCGSRKPFLQSDPRPADGKKLHFVLNVAWTRTAHCRLLHGLAHGMLLGKRQLLGGGLAAPREETQGSSSPEMIVHPNSCCAPSLLWDASAPLLPKISRQSTAHCFLGKNRCSANWQRGVEWLFPRTQQSLAVRHCPKKPSHTHAPV